MLNRNANQIWDAILGELEIRITRPSFETWLRGTVGISFVDSTLKVRTGSTFAAEMLGNRMYSLIADAASRVLKGPVTVKFQVAPIDSSPAQKLTDQNNTNESITDRITSPNPVLGTKMDNSFTFDNFVVGSSNALAHAAAGAVCDQPGKAYNPLFIYSNSGLGKTHLLQAIGHNIKKRGGNLLYASTEQFTNEYIGAIRNRTTDEFRDKYRNVDLLLLDDIQFIIGKEQTQEGFFHTFNSLHMDKKQIVITCDRPAKMLSSLTDRIRTRLEGGLVVDIQPPDLETRVAILESKANKHGIKIPTDVLFFIAEISQGNVRELEGNLNRVIAYSQLTQIPITMDLVNRSLPVNIPDNAVLPVTEKTIMKEVCKYFATDPKLLISSKRDRKTSLARHITMYLLRLEMNKQFAEIGRILGGRDHTTVIHACNRIASLIGSDDSLRSDVKNILLHIQKR